MPRRSTRKQYKEAEESPYEDSSDEKQEPTEIVIDNLNDPRQMTAVAMDFVNNFQNTLNEKGRDEQEYREKHYKLAKKQFQLAERHTEAWESLAESLEVIASSLATRDEPQRKVRRGALPVFA
jgi:hypothetical protein